jgi:hypothetical protein
VIKMMFFVAVMIPYAVVGFEADKADFVSYTTDQNANH